MTDQEMRDRLLRELESRVIDCENAASEEWHYGSVSTEPDRIEHYRVRSASSYRYAEHWRQAIDLLKAAPIPAKDEPR